MSELKATRRKRKSKIMIRFWCDEDLKKQFYMKIAETGVKNQDFFTDCMKWFIEGKIK